MYTIKDGNETISDSSNNEKEQALYSNREEKQSYDLGRWTPNEHQLFLEALVKYGNEWKQIQEYIKTRSSAQARSHAQKYFIRLKKEFRGISDVSLIKQKIQQKFQYDLQDNFNPKSLPDFLEIMVKLIYINEDNILNYSSASTHKKKLKNMKIAVKGVAEKRKRTFERSMSKAKMKKSREKTIFRIERNLQRKRSINADIIKPLPKKNRAKCHMSKNKKRQTKSNPPCIHILTINMFDNSTNNYLHSNMKHTPSNSSLGLPMNQNGITPVEDICGNTLSLETKRTKNNPFFIQFDPDDSMKNDIENNINHDNNFNNDFYPL